MYTVRARSRFLSPSIAMLTSDESGATIDHADRRLAPATRSARCGGRTESVRVARREKSVRPDESGPKTKFRRQKSHSETTRNDAKDRNASVRRRFLTVHGTLYYNFEIRFSALSWSNTAHHIFNARVPGHVITPVHLHALEESAHCSGSLVLVVRGKRLVEIACAGDINKE